MTVRHWSNGTPARILDYLSTYGGWHTETHLVSQSFGIQPDSIRRALYRLHESGRVRRRRGDQDESDGGIGYRYEYSADWPGPLNLREHIIEALCQYSSPVYMDELIEYVQSYREAKQTRISQTVTTLIERGHVVQVGYQHSRGRLLSLADV